LNVSPVADTGPLNYLILIGEVELLPALFGDVAAPKAVAREMAHEGAPDVVRHWVAEPPAWLHIHDDAADGADFAALDAGERAVLALARALNAPLVVMDDRRGVAAALASGFAAIGTLGVLYRSALRGAVDLRAAFDRLSRTNFRAKPELLESLLARLTLSKP